MSKNEESTLSALIRERPKRGRPFRSVSRQNVYVALFPEQKTLIKQLAKDLPLAFKRADVPDIAISLLAVRLEALRRAVSDRDREMPEGVTALESLYLLWDLPLPKSKQQAKWTSIRLSPQQIIELGRSHGALNALFGATRSQVFSLALALLHAFLKKQPFPPEIDTIYILQEKIEAIYL